MKVHIPGSKLYQGIRLPHEDSNIDDGYAANGPVKTYMLPPEEVERIFAQAKKPDGKPPLKRRNKKKEEGDEKMAGLTRLEKARLMLTKDQYIEMKQEGMTDAEIMHEVFKSNTYGDVFGILKQEWGIAGKYDLPPAKYKSADQEPEPEAQPEEPVEEKAEDAPEDPAVETELETEVRTLTINEAIKLWDKYIEENEIMEHMLANANGKLNRLQEAFENTTVTI